MKIWSKIKKWLGIDKKNSAKQNKTKKKVSEKKVSENMAGIPKEVLDKLPPGVKIKKIEVGPKQIVRMVIYGVLIWWLVMTMVSMFASESVVNVPLSKTIEAIRKDKTAKITVMDDQVLVEVPSESKILVSAKEPNSSMAEILQREGIDLEQIDFKVENRQGWKILGEVFSLLLTVGLPLLFIFWIFSKQTKGRMGGGGMFGFGKSPAKLFVKGKQSIRFKDVAGVEEAKNDLMEVVDFLKHPDKYVKMGARVPKGVLLIGPSGVGKTLLAKAVAGEAGVSFYSMAGSEFMEMLVGVGASRVRDLFSTAKKAGKAIIFIDEIDAIGRMRGGLEGGHGEREQTLNQILVEMDGFEPKETVIVLAATNRGDLLDPALMRPGRFDRRVMLEMPDIDDRKAILKIHAKGKPFSRVDWEEVARGTVGFSGADLENMLNEAAIGATRAGKKTISMTDINEASLKVKLGAEKRRKVTEKDRKMTAYHEAGHAIVNYALDLDPVERISIVSRGMALGFTLTPPKRDRVHETKSRLIKQMAMAMGGRAAEELVFDDITTGAAADISHATRIARRMVIEWGMSDLGPVNMGKDIDVENWTRTYETPDGISDETRAKVDDEIKKLLDMALTEARKTVKKYKKKMDKIAEVLVKKESLDRKEFENIMK